MEFKVGQVVYLIPQDKMSVVPLQVVEEIQKRSIDKDTNISYTVRYSLDDNKSYDINQLKGEMFESIEKVKDTLSFRSAKAINAIIDSAEKKANELFGSTNDKKNIPTQTHKLGNEVHSVQMPDGEIVKVTMK